MLIAAAAKRWGVDPATCHAKNGVVFNASGSKHLSYGELAKAAAKLPVPPVANVKLKDPKDFTLIGTRAKRVVGWSDAAPESRPKASLDDGRSAISSAIAQGASQVIAAIALELQAMGYTNKRGAPYSASCVKSMVEGPTPSIARAVA